MTAASVSPEVGKLLNLLRGSPTFVLFEGDTPGDDRLEQVECLVADNGVCWVSGTLTSASGQELEAVHLVSTDDGGELVNSFVWIDGWYYVQDASRGPTTTPFFPFDYTLSIPLDEDHHC